MERLHVTDADVLPGYDSLQFERYFARRTEIARQPPVEDVYKDYCRIHKVFVGISGSKLLREIHAKLSASDEPRHLDAAGWAAAEAALVDDTASAVERIALIESAQDCWARAMGIQERINGMLPEYEVEDDAIFRHALDLAFAPMMKAIIAGNATESIRERTFSDVLAVAQLAGVQRMLAAKEGSAHAFTQLLGFEHECNAHLTLLHINDARYLPLPSTARGGSGTTYPEQTHDIVLINQHWGKIRKIIPLEIKSKASLHDIKRYDALVVRGKMHLSVTGKYSPEHTRNAFAAYYSGEASSQDNRTVFQVTSTMKNLLRLYQKGGRQNGHDSPTVYHDFSVLERTRPEFSLTRPERYS